MFKLLPNLFVSDCSCFLLLDVTVVMLLQIATVTLVSTMLRKRKHYNFYFKVVINNIFYCACIKCQCVV